LPFVAPLSARSLALRAVSPGTQPPGMEVRALTNGEIVRDAPTP
jgi:hypothetical protein